MKFQIATDYLLPDPPEYGHYSRHKANTTANDRRQGREILLMNEAIETGRTFTEFEWDRHCVLNAGCFCSADSYLARQERREKRKATA